MDKYRQCIRVCDKMTIDNNLCPCYLRFKVMDSKKTSNDTQKGVNGGKK